MEGSAARLPTQIVIYIVEKNSRSWSSAEGPMASGSAPGSKSATQQDSRGPTSRYSRLACSIASYIRGKLEKGLLLLVALLD